MSKSKKKGVSAPSASHAEIETFEDGIDPNDQTIYRAVALKDVTRPTDHYQAFQPMVVHFQGDRVLKVELIGKPDLFHAAFVVGESYIDPREQLDNDA